MWANYQRPWAGIASNSTKMKTAPKSRKELWDRQYAQKIIVPPLQSTEGLLAFIAGAHLETDKPYQEAQYKVEAAFKKLKSLKTNLLSVYTNAPQAINLLDRGDI